VFGAVERPVADAKPDVVVVVRGPETDMRVRRKDRVAGIWINRNRVVLRGMALLLFRRKQQAAPEDRKRGDLAPIRPRPFRR